MLGSLRRGFGVGILFVLVASNLGFRRDDLLCDAAASHLSECCPDLDAEHLDCRFHAACGGEGIDLEADESLCIRALDCEAVVDQGICERVAARHEARNASDGVLGLGVGGGESEPPASDATAVCP